MGCGSSNAVPPTTTQTLSTSPSNKPTEPTQTIIEPIEKEKEKDILIDSQNDIIKNQIAKDLANAKIKEAEKLEEQAKQAASEAIALQMAEDFANKQIEEAKKLEEEANKAAAEAIANQIAGDLANKQMEEARKKEEEAKLAVAESIANQMAEDLANKQMEEARKKEEEANKSAAEAIANQMAADLANKQMEEAKKKEEEANKAAAEAIANQMAADLAQQKKLEAEAKEKEAEEAKEKQLMDMMKSLGAKQRFQAARDSGKKDLMLDAAAEVVQGCWRNRLAKRKVALLKEEKLQLLREYAARKFQSLYRTRLAKRRVIALREEKIRLLKEGSARKLQSKYRTRLARKRVIAIREEKTRLMREACARKLQSKYRTRLAKKKVIRLRQEKEQLMESACARKLQCRFRSHMARKRVVKLKEEKNKLLREGYARKIQCRYRARLARKKVTNLRDQKMKLLQEAAAIKFQCAYRIKVARRKVKMIRSERGLDVTDKINAALLIQRVWRGVVGRMRVNRLLRENHPHTIVLSLKTASSLNTGDKSSPDPFVIATAYNLSSRTGGTIQSLGASTKSVIGKSKRRGSVIQGPATDTMTLLCYSQSKVVKDTISPAWNEDLLITGAQWNSQIILTVADQNMMGKITVLGQKVLEIKNYPRLYQGVSIDLDNINLDSYLIRIQDPLGKDLVSSDVVPLPPAGNISLSIRLPPLASNMCGWVLRESEGLMTLGSMKRRWVILLDGVLLYYEDQYTLNECKGVLILDEVGEMKQVESKEGPAIMLTHAQNQSENWTIKWDPNEPLKTNQMWERKLKRSLPKEVVAKYEASISNNNKKK